MPTEKVEDVKPVCLHPGHNPPRMMLFSPGKYKHTCPSCGNVIWFTVNRPTF